MCWQTYSGGVEALPNDFIYWTNKEKEAIRRQNFQGKS